MPAGTAPPPAPPYHPGMKKTAFGRTGLEVTPLGFGAAPIGFLKTDQDKVASILNFMLDQGVNLIDTAAGYEGSEALIGAAVGHRRAEYVLVSKCGTKVPDI
ncbi:MAG: aldo/keto reductase, partial [Phycisphaerales bacterium]|nr:aldo/keto reductase [Phycisphaerales bacterium]